MLLQNSQSELVAVLWIRWWRNDFIN